MSGNVWRVWGPSSSYRWINCPARVKEPWPRAGEGFAYHAWHRLRFPHFNLCRGIHDRRACARFWRYRSLR